MEKHIIDELEDEINQRMKLMANDGIKKICFVCEKEIDYNPQLIAELSNFVFACYKHESCDLEKTK